eukprot:gene94-253_t
MSQADGADVQKSHLFDQLKGLIQVVDQLRDVGLNQYISLPRIVVVGTQSSGKSSCLESVVGLDFLPRGDGVVTRRPLELRLKTLPPQADGKDQAYAIFDAVDKHKKFTDFKEVREQIDKQTDEIAGKKKGIIDDAIVINVFATGFPNLTVIDLPGITRVAMANTDQGEDIEQVTRDMAMRYIKDPLTIILAVIAANQDMSTSDALQLARRADPQGLRTIGVLTKIDIMDPGTDACKMLKGEDIPLRIGYCGLKMRSQADIKAGMGVKEGILNETKWFNAHPRYSKLPEGFVGTNALVEKLTKVFHRHLRRFLPEIKREIMDRKRSTSESLDKLGTGVPESMAEKQHVMWTLITAFCDMFNNTIRGKYDHYDNESMTAQLPPDEIEQAIRTHEGDSLPGFPSPDTFEFLILPHLKKIESPSVEVLNNVSNTLESLAQRIARNIFRRFPKLADEVLHLTTDILNGEREKCLDIVTHIVESQTGYLFTNDQSYLQDHGSMEPMYKEAEKKAAEEAAKAGALADCHYYLVIVIGATSYFNFSFAAKACRRYHHMAAWRAPVHSALPYISEMATRCFPSSFGFNLFRLDRSATCSITCHPGVPMDASTTFKGPGFLCPLFLSWVRIATRTAADAGPPPPPSNAEKFGQHAADAVNFGRQAAGKFGQSVFGGQQGPGARNKQSRYAGPFVEEIRRRLDAYFCLIIRNCRDAVPKAIGYFLVRAIQEKLQFELINKLNNSDIFSRLLGEPEEIVRERARLRSELKIMEDALQVLNRDPNLVKMSMGSAWDDDEPPMPVSNGRSQPALSHAPAPASSRPAPAPAPHRPAPAAAPAAHHRAPPPSSGYSAPKPAPPAPVAARPAPRGGLFDDGPSTGGAAKHNANPLFD